MDKKCFVQTINNKCVIEDSDVIITGVTAVVAVGLFVAGTAVFAPILSSLSQLPRK